MNDAIVTCARSWIGTRFHHQGRLKKTQSHKGGVDCLGLGGDWKDNVDVPLNEASELYDVDIMNGVTVVRSFVDLASTTATYTAAQQIADFGIVQSSISIKVYQKSAMVGRGYAGVAAV